MRSDFTDKIAVVTGGGQGIGRAIATALLQAGATVYLADIDAAAGAATTRELSPLGPVEFVQTDVADPVSVTALQQRVASHGGLDLLVNNAGIMIRKTLSELSPDEWQRVLAVNLSGPFLCSRAFAPLLQKRQGSIINIASTRAVMSEADTESYAASKGGLVALTHALAVSLGPHIRVNAISPGWIDVRPAPAPPLTASDHAQHPAGRVGRPDDVATLVLYLASNQAAFITGQNFVVDGGMTRKMVYAEDD